LVAGYSEQKGNDDNPLILQKSYNWSKIKSNVKDIIFINSSDDPWGCDDQAGLVLFKNLGGTIIIREGEGHMGSDSFNQPYKTFPLLEKLLELKYSRSSIDGSDKF
jgi:predicted alpha/beta hydrolase family esterase